MPITFPCPECGTENDFADHLAGCAAVCSRCGRHVIVPATCSATGASQPRGANRVRIDGPVIAHGCLLLLATVCLLLGRHFHNQYADAHAAAEQMRRFLVPGVNPRMLGLNSPEPFFKRAQLMTLAVLGICVLEFGVAVTTRRFVSFVSLLICCLLLMIANSVTGVRF